MSCCVDVQASKSINEFHLTGYLKSILALQQMQGRVLSGSKNRELSGMIQAYNGTGVLGSSEKLAGSCFDGLNMAKSPIYGARVADLMVNSVMTQPEIQRMTQAAAAEFRKPIPSILCAKAGPGRHQLEPDRFLAEQRKYVLEDTPARKAACEPLFHEDGTLDRAKRWVRRKLGW